MSLILYYVVFMIGGDVAAYFLGLLVEYEWGTHVAWMLAVWVTRPRDAASSAR